MIVSVSVIDETIDTSLRDPAVGTKNFGEPGAARMKYTAVWQADRGWPDRPFYHRLDFINGQVFLVDNTDQTPSGVLEAIAQYDRNANGDYIVTGLTLSYIGDDFPTRRTSFRSAKASPTSSATNRC